MPQSRRALQATAALTETPPATLPASHNIARIVKAEGNNLYSVVYPRTTARPNQKSAENQATDVSQTALVELHARFRNKIWLKRGGYVIVDREAFANRENKLDGEIVNVVRDEKEWRKRDYWPAEFRKRQVVAEDSDEEESLVGRMPPSDSSSEDNEADG